MTSLTTEELTTLETMRADARGEIIQYWEIYDWLADLLVDTKGVASTDSTVLWLRGATEANAGRGAMASLIRTFTDEQHELRYGSGATDADMQRASDEVAENLIRDLLGESEDGWPEGLVPDISRIAKSDATAVGKVLFNRDTADTSAEENANSAWAGTLLFNMLGSDQTSRLYSTGDKDDIDTLNDLRDVLYAASSYEAGVVAAGITFLSQLGSYQTAVDVGVMGATINAFWKTGGGSLYDTLMLGASNGPVGDAFKVIGKIGEERILDMVTGAYYAEVFIGETDEDNYSLNARGFFGTLTPEQLGNRPIEITDGAKLAMEALADTPDKNALAALAALSVVKVEVEQAIADELTIYDEATGDGAFSIDWIVQRGRMVSAFLQDEEAVVTASRYFDAASGVEILVGDASPDQCSQVQFGSDSSDALAGFDYDDSLFGMEGSDTLDGRGGSDWLEGGLGDDFLDGGAGRDILVGAGGADTMSGGAGVDELRGGNGSDEYLFSAEWGIDLIVDADGGLLTVAGFEAGLPAASVMVTEGIWRSADDKVTFTRIAGESGGYDLVISFKDQQGRILLKDWQSGGYGITLGDTQDTPPETVRSYFGDQRAKIVGEEIDNGTYHDYRWDITSWQINGVLTNGVQDAGFSDAILGSDFADTMEGRAGNDELYGADGSDLIRGESGNDLLAGGRGQDWIEGGTGNDYILSGDDLVIRRQVNLDDPSWTAPNGEVTLISGDTWGVTTAYVYYGQPNTDPDDESDFVDGGEGDDTALGGHGSDTLIGGQGADQLWGLGGGDVLQGGIDDDFLFGDGTPVDPRSVGYCPEDLVGSDVLHGGAGADHLYGIGGGDVLMGGEGNDDLHGDAGSGQENWLSPAGHGQDYLDGGLGADTLEGEGNDDVLVGGSGNDVLCGDMMSGNSSFVGNDALYGGDGLDILLGGGGNDRLDGGADDDELLGGQGDDTLIGGLGFDHFDGGDGDDVYVISEEEAGDGVLQRLVVATGPGVATAFGDFAFGWLDRVEFARAESVASGSETVFDDVGYNTVRIDGEVRSAKTSSDGNLLLSIGDPENQQHLLIYNAFFDAVGSLDLGGQAVTVRNWVQENVTQAVVLTTEGAEVSYAFGAAGNDVLYGKSGGNDTLDGGAGNDRLFGYGDADSLFGAEGNDELNGGDGDDVLSGGDGIDELWAGSGSDSIDGGEGDDVIEWAGGSGNDAYLFGHGDGHDVVTRGSPSIAEANTLRLKEDVEPSDVVVRRIWRTYVDDDGYQRSGYVDLEVSLAATGESILFQDFSRDDDPFAAGSPLSRVEFADGTVWDLTEICRRAGAGSIFDDELVGFDFVQQTIQGLDGNDTLLGGNGDTLLGDGGDDLLSGDVVRAEGGDGNDQLHGGLLSTLLGGGGDDVLYGGSSLFGNAGNDYLNADAALLDGGDGNDLLTGTERSTLVGGAGNDQLNAISGGSAAQHARLQGGLGDDSLQGALHTELVFAQADGNDRYRGWDNADGSATAADRTQLHLGAGFSAGALGLVLDGHDLRLDFGTGDTLTLADYFADTGATKRGADAQISVGLMHFAGDGSTHDVREWITSGSNSADTLAGSAGSDLIAGHLGNDRLDGGQGDDGLHGGVGDDSLIGGEGHDTLVGALGRDTLVGGLGDDVYHLDDSDAAASEAANAGTDTVVYSAIRYSPVTEYTLRDNFEHLTLAEGTAATTGHGNALANRLTGNALDNTLNGNGGADSLVGGLGHDSLDGGAGADSAQGGQGDDVFFTDDALDLTIELLGEGIDTVWASVNWQLAANIENLQLDGAATRGAGNALGNQLTGNDLANTLQGLDGADTLDGGLGNDKLDGGKGADTYRFGLGSGKDTVIEKDATLDVRDLVDFGALNHDQVRFTHVGDNLEVKILGSADKLVVKDWYLGDRYQVEDFRFADGTWDGDDLAPVALEAAIDAALAAVRRPDGPGDAQLMI